MQHLTDVRETKRTALFYIMGCFCNDDLSMPLSQFARFCSITATTEDLIAALELPAANEDDCHNWKISSVEWYLGLQQALYQHIIEALKSESIEYDGPEPLTTARPGRC